jgi:DNA-binding FadR family transcriptional regulator
MTTLMPLLHLQPSSSGDWLRYFKSNAAEPSLPWRDPYRLTASEHAAAAGSIRQFQLGESGKGRRLLDQAARFAAERGEPEYWEALRLFVKEEQRHSRMLGRFLELHGIRPLDRHWVNGAFRGIRGLAGLELRMRVLATAEVLAMPFYLALREATASPLLRAICDRILEEEAMHLRFQAFTFRLFQSARPAILRCLTWVANRMLLAGTEAVLWREHRAVFRAAGYSRKRLADEASRWFAELGWA